MFLGHNTVCPRSSDPLYIVTYDKKWVTTSWTYSIWWSLMWNNSYICRICRYCKREEPCSKCTLVFTEWRGDTTVCPGSSDPFYIVR